MTTVQLKKLKQNPRYVFDLAKIEKEVRVADGKKEIGRVLPPERKNRKKADMVKWAKEMETWRKKVFPNGGLKGDPQKFWDEIRGDCCTAVPILMHQSGE